MHRHLTLNMKTMKIKITVNPLLTYFARHDTRTNEDMKVVCQHVGIVESIRPEPNPSVIMYSHSLLPTVE